MDIFKALGFTCCASCTDKEKSEMQVSVVPERGVIPNEDEVHLSGCVVDSQQALTPEETETTEDAARQNEPSSAPSREPEGAPPENSAEWVEAPQAEAPPAPAPEVEQTPVATTPKAESNEPAPKAKLAPRDDVSRGSSAPSTAGAAKAAPKAAVASKDPSRTSSAPSTKPSAKEGSRTNSRDTKKAAPKQPKEKTPAELQSDAASKLAKEGDDLFAKKHMSEAQDKYSAAIEQDPKCVAGWVGRGGCKLRSEAWNEAKADLTKALEIDPSNLYALRDRAEVYLKLKEYDLCILDFDAKLLLAPADGKALFGRGDAKLRKGDKEGAAADLSMAAHLGFPGAKELLKKAKS